MAILLPIFELNSIIRYPRRSYGALAQCAALYDNGIGGEERRSDMRDPSGFDLLAALLGTLGAILLLIAAFAAVA